MPSPVLHLSAGASICLLDRGAVQHRQWRELSLIIFASILPDLDVLPGLLMGDPNRFHAGVSHSVGFAALAAGLAALICRGQRWRVSFWVFLAYMSHCVLDGLNFDSRPPQGVPVAWPITSETLYYPVLEGVRHGHEGATIGQFVADVFSLANLQQVSIEAGIGAVLIVMSSVTMWAVARGRANASVGRPISS